MDIISKKAREIEPYVAGEQPQDKKYIKLNTNENPYSPSPRVQSVIQNFDVDALRLYPDPKSEVLRSTIASVENVAKENVFVGNGSDEVLALSFLALFNSHSKYVLFPDITYSFYPVFCKLYDINYMEVPLKQDFTIDIDDYMGERTSGIVLANPNAPTGISLSAQDLEKIIEQNSSVAVIIDEAYIDFATNSSSCVSLTKKYPNLLVVKTFSKSYGLAGIRCGYAVGNTALIDGLNRIKDSFNSYPVDRVCSSVCVAAAQDTEYKKQCVEKIIASRNSLVLALEKMGLRVLPSDANFVFVEVHNGKAAYEFLRENGILVRRWDKPRIADFLRVTIGEERDNNIFVETLAKYITKSQNFTN